MILKGASRLIRDRRGATAVEYGLIVALIVIVVIASIGLVAGRTTSIWFNIANKVGAVTPNG